MATLAVKEALLAVAIVVKDEGIPCRIAYLPMASTNWRAEASKDGKRLTVVLRNPEDTMDIGRVVLDVVEDGVQKPAN